jgi:small-conductance mechanosensitive channel
MSPRRARLVTPLLFATALVALYHFALNNRKWIDKLRLNLDSDRVLLTLLFLAWVPVIFFVVRLIDLVVFDFFASRRGTVKAPTLLRELVSIVVSLLLFALVFSSIFDKSVAGFLTTGTLLAAILGFALQDTLGNLFAGIALHLEDSFEIGDVIRSGDYIGTVEAVRWRGTRLRTFNNNIVIVPNSVLARDRVEVYPRNNLNARVLPITVSGAIPPSDVIAVLTRAASGVEGISREVPCLARVVSVGASTVNYEVKYFTEDYSQRDRIDAEVCKAAWYAFREAGIVEPV